jgi:hypothetical protein
MRRETKVELGQPGHEGRFVTKYRSRGVVGMARLPIRENQDSRTQLPYDTRDLGLIFDGVLDSTVGDVQCLPPANVQNASSFGSFAGPIFDGAASAHLALGEIKDGSAATALRHLQQGSATGLLDIIAMCRNGQDVDPLTRVHEDYTPDTSFSLGALFLRSE